MESITNASPELVEEIRAKWTAIGLATGPGDMEEARAAVQDAYLTAGLDPPRHILVLPTPLHGAIAASSLEASGKALVRDLRKRVENGARDRVKVKVQPSDWAVLREAIPWALVFLGVTALWIMFFSWMAAIWNGISPGWQDVLVFSAMVGVPLLVLLPLAGIAIHIVTVVNREEVWERLRDQVLGGVGAGVRARVPEIAWVRRVGNSESGFRWVVVDAVRASVWEGLETDVQTRVVNSAWRSLAESGWHRGPRRVEVPGDGWQPKWEVLAGSVWGRDNVGWLAEFDLLRRLGLSDDELVVPLTRLAQQVETWWPYEDWCILTERPKAIHVDERGRLHCGTGPAVDYGLFGLWAWHGVLVSQRVIKGAFTAQDVLSEPNIEVRRVMMERMGLERFMCESKAITLHRDIDGAGQPRQLLRIGLTGDEPLVVVQVTDPSTGRQYHLRVPPNTQWCDEAVAWSFGVRTEEYAPMVER